jgi:hypothetical protein
MIELADDAPTTSVVSLPSSKPLSAEFLKTVPPKLQGYCEKESNSVLAHWFPWWFPRWKRRYLITCGSFLFRFADEQSDAPKGIPIPLDISHIKYIEGTEFVITNLWKDYKIRLSTEHECREWVRVLRTRKHECIRENMGHASVDEKVKLINKIATRKLEKKINKLSHTIEDSSDVFNPITYMSPTGF